MSSTTSHAPAAVPPPPRWPAKPAVVADSARAGRGAAWVVRLAFVAAAITLSFEINQGIFAPVIALFVIVAPFEKLYPRQKGQKVRRPMVATDVSFALMSPALNVVAIAAIVLIGGLSLFWVPGLLMRPIIGALPSSVLPIVAFVLFDFLGYWTHRWAHEVPFLWRFHAVHHSPEHMDWVSGFRVHPFDGVLIAPAAFFLLAAGFDPQLAGALAVIQIILGLFFHANVRVRWRWLDKLVANPEFHHWHHANEADSIGHNYAAALPQWDLMFGTYFMPKGGRRPQHYGVDEYMPRHVFGLLTYPLRGGRKHLWLPWHPIRAAKTMLSGALILLTGVRRSTFRPTHAVRRPTLPGCTSTNGSLFDSASRPGWTPPPDSLPGSDPLISPALPGPDPLISPEKSGSDPIRCDSVSHNSRDPHR